MVVVRRRLSVANHGESGEAGDLERAGAVRGGLAPVRPRRRWLDASIQERRHRGDQGAVPQARSLLQELPRSVPREGRLTMRVRVWDLPTRVTHALLIVLLAILWLTVEQGWMVWHRVAGYAMLTLDRKSVV